MIFYIEAVEISINIEFNFWKENKTEHIEKKEGKIQITLGVLLVVYVSINFKKQNVKYLALQAIFSCF